MVVQVSRQVDPLFDQYFRAVQMLYWYMPLNPYRHFIGPISQRDFLFGRFCYVFVVASQFLLMVLYAVFLIDAVATGGDFILTAATFVWFILDIEAFQSLYFSWNSSSKIVELLQLLHESFPRTAEEQERVGAVEWTKRWAFKMNVETFLFFAAVSGMCARPMIESFVRYLITGVWENQLPLTLWLPFDGHSMPLYPLVYLLEIWFFLVNSLIIVAVVAILGGVTMLICLQFKGAAMSFREIEFGDYGKDLLTMQRAIQYHNHTLELSLKIREVFSVPLFSIFVISSVVICVFTFLTVSEDKAVDRFQYTANSISFLIFCVFNSYFGNELIEHSLAVGDAAYESNWTEADVRIQKLIVFIIQRASYPEELTGLNFFSLSFPTLSKILTSSYSYFTLLRTTYQK